MAGYPYGRTLPERLFARLTPDPETGCLLWTGQIARNGYGMLSLKNKPRRVHRLMWELFNGTIPDGLVIDHVKARGCSHRHCANIEHLELVTLRENLLRGDTIAADHAAKTHCPQGHAYDEANTYTYRGKRQCRACARERRMAHGK